MTFNDFIATGLSRTEKIQFYMDRMAPLLNKRALFSDGNDFYCHYEKKNDKWYVRLRFRTARENADLVEVIADKVTKKMRQVSFDRLFDYYEAVLEYPECGESYYYSVRTGKQIVYYNQRGYTSEILTYYNFRLYPEFRTPDWAKGAVFYQIMVDRFYNGDPSNDVIDHEYSYLHQHAWHENNWSDPPKDVDVCHFYGGDLKGVLDKLDYLQELGIEAIYLNPIFVSPSTHKYDTQDYDHIDPHFTEIVNNDGATLEEWSEDNSKASLYRTRVTDLENLRRSNLFFEKFVKEVHRRGMKIVLDGVFNHCGSFNKWMDLERLYEGCPGFEDGAFISEHSPYHDYFTFTGGQWPYNKEFLGWWGHITLPKLNYEGSVKLMDQVMEIGKKWVSPPYKIDGWRLDVAADLGNSREFNHEFWKEFRKGVKSVNKDALILAEHYSDPAEWLDGTQWDTIMNYEAFMEPISWFLTGMEKHSDEFRQDMINDYGCFESAMTHHMSRMPYQSMLTSMNELSNHDHSRFLTRTNHTAGRLQSRGSKAAEEGVSEAVMRIAVVMQMTWPGAPTVYYGDEAGLCGWTDPDNRRTYPWGHENISMLDFHKAAIRIHKESSALRKGSIKMLYGEYGIIAYGRFDKNEHYVMAFNNLNEKKEISIPVWEIGVSDGCRMQQLLLTTADVFTIETFYYKVKDGCINITMPPLSAIILNEVQD